MFPLKSALLVDYDNVAPFFPNFQFSGRVANWLSWLEAGGFDPECKKRRFVEKRVYWHRVFANEDPAFKQFDFTTKTCVYAAGGKAGQSAVDLHLAIDAIDIVNRLRNVKEVIILASDSDYVPVIERLQDKGVRTGIMFSTRDASAVYKSKADFIITESDLGAALSYVRARGRRKVAEIGAAPALEGQPRGAGAHNLLQPGKPAKKSAPPKPAPKPVARPGAPIDVGPAADAVVELAKAQPGLAVGRERVIQRLRKIEGFASDGGGRWFGFNSYEDLMREVARLRPELSIVVYTNNGIGIVLPKASGQEGLAQA